MMGSEDDLQEDEKRTRKAKEEKVRKLDKLPTMDGQTDREVFSFKNYVRVTMQSASNLIGTYGTVTWYATPKLILTDQQSKVQRSVASVSFHRSNACPVADIGAANPCQAQAPGARFLGCGV